MTSLCSSYCFRNNRPVDLCNDFETWECDYGDFGRTEAAIRKQKWCNVRCFAGTYENKKLQYGAFHFSDIATSRDRTEQMFSGKLPPQLTEQSKHFRGVLTLLKWNLPQNCAPICSVMPRGARRGDEGSIIPPPLNGNRLNRNLLLTFVKTQNNSAHAYITISRFRL